MLQRMRPGTRCRLCRGAVIALGAGLICALGATPASAANVAGTNGSDSLPGTVVNDNIFGKAGNDLLGGFGGNDLLLGGTGADAMQGGLGADTIVSDDGGLDNIAAGAGGDRVVSADSSPDTVDCGAGIDRAIADPFDVLSNCEAVTTATSVAVLFGTAGPDVLGVTLATTKVVAGRAGDDRIFSVQAAPPNLRVFLGPGSDVFDDGTANGQIIFDDDSNSDTIFALNGNDTIYSVSDPTVADKITCGAGFDTVYRDPSDGLAVPADCELVFTL